MKRVVVMRFLIITDYEGKGARHVSGNGIQGEEGCSCS